MTPLKGRKDGGEGVGEIFVDLGPGAFGFYVCGEQGAPGGLWVGFPLCRPGVQQGAPLPDLDALASGP